MAAISTSTGTSMMVGVVAGRTGTGGGARIGSEAILTCAAAGAAVSGAWVSRLPT